MNTPKFFELGDKDKDFWESQALGTVEGRAQMTALRAGLKEVLPSETELSRPRSLLFSRVTPKLSSQKRSPSLQRTGEERGSLKTDSRRRPYRRMLRLFGASCWLPVDSRFLFFERR